MTSRYSYHHRRHSHTIYFSPQDTKFSDNITMYGPPLPLTPPSSSRRLIRPAAPWHRNTRHYHESTLSRTPSLEDIHNPHHNSALHCHQPKPLTLPSPYTPSTRPHDLPSRISALNRRAAVVSAQLAHLTAVARPLESTKPERLSETQLYDMHQEGVGLVRALGMFEAQAKEVLEMLADLLGGGREVEEEEVDWMWEGAWERGMRVGKGARKGRDV
ncbi:hypothetical protein HBI56_154000 [Parastagonospora nodorum]|nr:hypothetical protein HBH53_072780 [Parastagonospora nodorum]KAH3973757.1 hypothetical protein HBH52_138990 [Parastagonospora nodorum]KAH3998815.1 hypothetical protein HBI10_125990 [Parastagonospora nodorum]KAH4024144.1 hypothetical protein HBI13_083550 [Parastagonospora nodorum]KAH4033870.1 hypothetical protein HBI09_113880 [Parastagonospora nodorum]